MVGTMSEKTSLFQVLIDSREGTESKVCVITSIFPPYPENVHTFRGGVSEELSELVNKLNEKQIPCTVISLSLFGLSPEHPQVKRVGKYVPYITSKFRQVLFPFYEFFNPIIFLKMVLILRKEKPSTALFGQTYQFSIAPHLACMVTGVKRIMFFDWLCPFYPKEKACSISRRIKECGKCMSKSDNFLLNLIIGLFSSFIFLVKRKLWNSSYRIVVQSDYQAQLFKDWGIDAEKFVMAPPTSTIRENDTYTAELLKTKGDGKAICYIGRLTEEKGFDLLLEAFRFCSARSRKNVKLFVAGSGHLKKEMENVEYLGWVTKDRLGSVYKIADLVVVPTVVQEIHPAVVDNALEYRKKIIAFKVGSLENIIGKRGILIDEISAEALARSICENI
jgi:glycosyltransferase involved in cell wall biosynthesis